MATPKKHNPANNLGKFLHPKAASKPADATAKASRTHLAQPSKPVTSKVVVGRQAKASPIKGDTWLKKAPAPPSKAKRPAVKACPKCGNRTSAAYCPSCGKKM